MKTLYLLPSFALVLLLSFSALAADGIDSAEGTDLPLNAQNTRVATLRATGTGNNKTGVLEVNGLLNSKGLVTAETGAKIGPVEESLCAGAQAKQNAGLMRYNTSVNQMQYCNGAAWTSFSATASAAAPTPKTCPGGTVRPLGAWMDVPTGKEGQNYCGDAVTASGQYLRSCYQCIDGTWVYTGQ